MLVVRGKVISHPRSSAMKVGTAQIFGGDNFTCGGFDKRWAFEGEGMTSATLSARPHTTKQKETKGKRRRPPR